MNRSQTPMRVRCFAIWYILPFFLATSISAEKLASPSNGLSCNNHVYASVGADCDIDLSAGALLQGNFPAVPYIVTLEEKNGVAVDPDDIHIYLGQDLIFNVQNPEGVYCWGYLTVEDKTPPVLTCETCAERNVTDPDCILNCAELELFTCRDPLTGQVGYDEDLLDKLVPSDPRDFIRAHVDDNCGQGIEASYEDIFEKGPACKDPTLLTRKWTVSYDNGHGVIEELTCKKFYKFNSISIRDAGNVPIIIEGDGSPVEDAIVFPKRVIEIPQCHVSSDPASIAAYYDDPETVDRDTDGDRLSPAKGDVDKVIENNEGIWYAYPHYYLTGLRPSGPHAQPLIDRVCGLTAYYTDTVLEVCEENCTGNIKISRIWTVADWCTGHLVDYQQILKLVDETPPVMDVVDVLASVDPWTCDATVVVPHPEHLFDECDEGDLHYEVSLINEIRTITGNSTQGYIIEGVSMGFHSLQYIGYDCCGNQQRKVVELRVKDLTPPVPVTKENLVIDLSPSGNLDNPIQGVAKLLAKDVDNASFDSCSEVEVFIRRPYNCEAADTIWGKDVRFCCDDLNGQEFAEIKVEMMAVDIFGNENFGWTNVRLEDKGGVLNCPLDVAIPCDVDYNNFKNTGGIPRTFTACAEVGVLLDTLDVIDKTIPTFKRAAEGIVPGYIGVAVPAYNPSCGFGAIKRNFGNCIQWIVLERNEQVTFDTSTLVFPKDLNLECLGGDTGEPDWLAAGCQLIGASVESDTFRFEGNACMKIHNKWSVIDWCYYNPLDPDLNSVLDAQDADGDLISNFLDTDDDNDGILDGTTYLDMNGVPQYEPDLFDPVLEDSGEVEGLYSAIQIIKIEDQVFPTIQTEDDLVLLVNGDCETKGQVISVVGDDQGDCPSPWIGWEIFVDLNENGFNNYIYSSYVPSVINGEPNPFYVPKTARGERLEIVLPDGIMPSKKKHTIDWIANDGCRNETQISTYFTIEDDRAPTPYCLDVGTAVMSNGQVELWAIDFNNGAFDNCSEDLFFTFTDVPPPPRNDEEYDREDWYDGSYWYFESSEIDDDPMSETFGYGTYEDLDAYGGTVHIWEPSTNSSGAIFTTDDIVVGDKLMLPVYVWDECYNYDFCLVELRIIDNGGGTSAKVSGQIAREDEQSVEAVETYLKRMDIAEATMQLTNDQGQFSFEENLMSKEYELTAVKNDDYLNGVSTVDLVRIQRHILGMELLDSPYKMIAADINNDKKINGSDLVELRKLILGIYMELPENGSWKFIDKSSILSLSAPWNYSEKISIQELNTDLENKNFIGVKIGDVDNSSVSAANSTPLQNRQNQIVEFEFEDRMLEPGEEFELAINTKADLHGFQLTMSLKDLTFIEVLDEKLSKDHLAFHSDAITMSYHNLELISGNLFKIKLKTNNGGPLSTLLDINSDITTAEAVLAQSLKSTEIRLKAKSDEAFMLLQNEPNPFSDQTMIGFNLPNDDKVKLTFYDVTGKILKSESLLGQKGMNKILFDGSTFEPGIIYYKLESDDNVAIRHMIYIR